MRYGLTHDVIQRIQNVFLYFPQVEKVILYGSRAKGNYKPGSDIDLTFMGADMNLKVLNEISLQLDELYLPYTFDLSIYHHIQNTDLLEHIERVGVEF